VLSVTNTGGNSFYTSGGSQGIASKSTSSFSTYNWANNVACYWIATGY
jgi:hypothetical protein